MWLWYCVAASIFFSLIGGYACGRRRTAHRKREKVIYRYLTDDPSLGAKQAYLCYEGACYARDPVGPSMRRRGYTHAAHGVPVAPLARMV